MKTLYSSTDRSVNFVQNNMQESRFVQRIDDYFIVYLSSQNGCNKACRFCHLTQTKQTDMEDATLADFVEQARHPLAHYETLVANGAKRAITVNFNFMARGEVFANKNVLERGPELLRLLSTEIGDLTPSFNFSTIGPTELEHLEFTDIIPTKNTIIYYSLYSVDADFRKRWMPKALPVDAMMQKLRRWQDSGGAVALHWAFIEGVNDSKKDVDDILAVLDYYGLKAKFNLVRYNPFSPAQGVESKRLEENFKILADYLLHPHSRIVPRVGYDVQASCGMFVSKELS